MAPSLLPTKPKLKMKGYTRVGSKGENERKGKSQRYEGDGDIHKSFTSSVVWSMEMHQTLAFVLSYCRKVSM
jgi:hypothetical protein